MKYLLIIAIVLGSIFYLTSDSKNDDVNADNIKLENVTEDNVTEGKSINESNQYNNSSKLKVEDLAGDDQITERPKNVLEESIDKILISKNKGRDIENNDGSIYVVVGESTVIPSNKNGFINSRNIAFSKALLKAKMKILGVQEQIITTEKESNFISRLKDGNDPDLSKKASFLEKIGKLANQSVDQALIKLGMDETDVMVMNQNQKEKAFSDSFRKQVSSCVASMIRGISIVKVAEGEIGDNNYEIAICVKYSPEDQALSSNQNELGAGKDIQNSEAIKKIRSLSPEKLITMLGAKFYTDENGNRFALGFGQRSVRKSTRRQSTFEDMAQDQSILDAKENLSNLLAEDIIGKEIQEDIEKETEYQDGEYSIYTETNFSRLIKSKKRSIKMSTITIKNWSGVHPVSNTKIMGSIVLLTEKNSVNFNKNTIKKVPNNSNEKTKSSNVYESDVDDGADF
tara:strand:- start:2756 stop:4126 length:1371 start_codon:yes stop_codon:yes gene_type:complete